MRARLPLPGLAGAVAFAVLVFGTLALAALNTGGEVRLGPLTLFKLSAGYARAAERAMAGPDATREDQVRAAALSAKAVAEFPYDNSSWLRLALADRLQHGRLTPRAAGLLQRSYDLVAVDIYAGVWRIGFVLENSQSVPKDVRDAARNEFATLWRSGKHQAELRALAKSIQNPAGRLSAALWINRLERAPRARAQFAS